MAATDTISHFRALSAVASLTAFLSLVAFVPGLDGFRDAFVLYADTHYTLLHPWTLLTYSMVHATPAHFMVNMIVLVWCGYLLGVTMSSARFLSLYLAGVIAGGLVWLLAETPANSGASLLMGASAGILALLGKSFIDRIRNPRSNWIILFLILFLVILTISCGSIYPHLGGLLTGMATAFKDFRSAPYPPKTRLLGKVARSGYSCLTENEKRQLHVYSRKHSQR